MLASVEKCVIILHIFMYLIFFFKYDSFFFIKSKTSERAIEICFSRSFRFILVLSYELNFLKNYVTYPK
jgi:hypothetical protein